MNMCQYSNSQICLKCTLRESSNWKYARVAVWTLRLEKQDQCIFPGLAAHTKGRGVLLVFDEDADSAMRKICDHDGCKHYMQSDPQQENIVHLFFWQPVPRIISDKCIGGIGFYDPVQSQHQNSVKLLVKTSGSTDIVTVADVQHICTLPRWCPMHPSFIFPLPSSRTSIPASLARIAKPQ